MREEKIKIILPRDCDNEDFQSSLVRNRLKDLKIIDSMKIYTDKIIIQFLKLMLYPTGKVITFMDHVPKDLPTGLKLVTLQEFIEGFNEKIDKRSVPGLIQPQN